MATIGVNIFPESGEIRVVSFPQSATAPGDSFSILYVAPNASIYVATRPVLDALQAALDEIRADMDAEPEAVAS
jgi:hypothetical protein